MQHSGQLRISTVGSRVWVTSKHALGLGMGSVLPVLGRDIGKRLEVRRKVDACLGKSNYISRLEHAQARLTLSYNRRGDLAIHLVSPMGTRSTLLAARYVPSCGVPWDSPRPGLAQVSLHAAGTHLWPCPLPGLTTSRLMASMTGPS